MQRDKRQVKAIGCICGGEIKLNVIEGNLDDGELFSIYWVECEECQEFSDASFDKEGAINSWNKDRTYEMAKYTSNQANRAPGAQPDR